MLTLWAAVFMWGLRVKLSHDSSSPVHDKIVVKLVQDWRCDNEPGAKKFSVLRPTRRGAQVLSADIAVALVAPCFPVPGIRPSHGSVAASIAACPLALFSRPPPQGA